MVATIANNETEQAPADWDDVYHVGPGTLAGNYLRTFWHPVFLARELPAGKARPIRVLGEDFTLYRGESGRPHVVAFRCAHRRTQLSIGWVEGDTIRCRYHGWAYDATGQCLEQPGESEPFCDRIKIRGYPTEEYLGLIFAYVGEGEAPPLPRYVDAEAPGVIETLTYERRCSFYNNVDNDVLHVAFVHRWSVPDWHTWKAIPTLTAEETDFGVTQHVTRGNGSISQTLMGMPAISYRPYAREIHDPAPTTHLAWRTPIDNESHRGFLVDVVHLTGEEADAYRKGREGNPLFTDPYSGTPEIIQQILAGDIELDSLREVERIRLVNFEDGATQVGQGEIPDRENEHLGRSDTGVMLHRRIWAREMRALAEGRPIKRWTPPPARTPAP